MITVMGASGHNGSKIAQSLLDRGEQVRALGRSEHKLAALARRGAEVGIGDAADAAFLTEAFRGADAVFTLLPTSREAPDYLARQREESEAVVTAIRQSGVRHVVALSSVGADVAEGTGPIAGLHAHEERLRRLDGANVLLLRPVSFFENFYDQLDSIAGPGVVADTVPADLAMPMVATRDVAETAVHWLAAHDWRGKVVRELLGPRDLSYGEAARIIGQRIGKPELQYIQLAESEMAAVLVVAGLSESFANLYVEMNRAFTTGLVSHGARTAEDRSGTPFEIFADELTSVLQTT